MSASPLFDKINADIITAMKAKAEADLSALRMLKSAIKYKEVDLKREVTDEDVIDVLPDAISLLEDVYPWGSRPNRDSRRNVPPIAHLSLT